METKIDFELTEQYRSFFDSSCMKIIYDMMRTKAFIPVGLDLSSTSIYFNDNNTFPLKELTFAYYNPVENSIHINIEDKFFTECTGAKGTLERTAKLFFVLFHEVMHKILMHIPERINNRKPDLWNIACDYEVHNMYYMYSKTNNNDSNYAPIMAGYLGIVDEFLINNAKHSDFLFDMNYLDKIAEEIYTLIENSKEESNESFTFDLNDMMENSSGNNGSDDESEGNSGKSGIEVTVEKTTYTLPNGKKYTSTNIKWPNENMLPEELKKSDEQKAQEQQNKVCNKSLLENTFEQMAKEKGSLPEACQKFLKKLFHIKIDWAKILRNSLQTILEKTDYFAWSKIRTSSFLLPGMSYLPDIIEDEEKYGTLIISRDESGSMSDEEIAKAGGIIMDAKEFYKKIVLIKHDTSISKIYEFEEISNDIIKALTQRESCGGTSHKEVFKYLENYQEEHAGEKISCYIGITDMESDIQKYQKLIPSNVPVIYLAPVNSEPAWNGVDGKIIPIEL